MPEISYYDVVDTARETWLAASTVSAIARETYCTARDAYSTIGVPAACESIDTARDAYLTASAATRAAYDAWMAEKAAAAAVRATWAAEAWTAARVAPNPAGHP